MKKKLSTHVLSQNYIWGLHYKSFKWSSTFCCSIETALLHMTHDTRNSWVLGVKHVWSWSMFLWQMDLRRNTMSLQQDAACDGGTPAHEEVLSGASSQCTELGTFIQLQHMMKELPPWSSGTKRSFQSMLQIHTGAIILQEKRTTS